MAFLDFLPAIGSALVGGLAGGQDQTTTATNEPWEAVQDNLKRLHPAAENVWQNMMPYYPGATYAPMNPLQIGGQFGMLDYAQNRFQPGVSTYQQNLQNMMSQDVASNPAVQGMMAANNANVTDWLKQEALPGVRSSAAMAGQVGSSRQGIGEGLAIGKGAQALAGANSETMMRAFNPIMAQQTAAAGMMPNALNMGFQGPQTALNVGSMQQDQFQRGINEAMQRYYYPQEESKSTLDWLNNIFLGSGALGSSQSQTLPGNPIGSALGAGLMGYSLFNQDNSGTGGGQNIWGSPGVTWSDFNQPSTSGINLAGSYTPYSAGLSFGGY